MIKGVLLVTIAASVSVTEAAPPKSCSVAFLIDKVTSGDVTGTIASLTPQTQGILVKLDDGKAGLEFRYVADVPAKLAKGDKIRVRYRCGGPPPGMYCDAQLADASGRVLVVTSMNGSDDLSDGWTSARGKVMTSRQDPNQTEKSIEHTHELVLKKGKATVTTRAGACIEVNESGTTWYATGSARSWEGVRPPEGIDYRSYSLVRAN